MYIKQTILFKIRYIFYLKQSKNLNILIFKINFIIKLIFVVYKTVFIINVAMHLYVLKVEIYSLSWRIQPVLTVS